nr:MAG TPA: hypothetical protein [Caudoviricetes sp.]
MYADSETITRYSVPLSAINLSLSSFLTSYI